MVILTKEQKFDDFLRIKSNHDKNDDWNYKEYEKDLIEFKENPDVGLYVSSVMTQEEIEKKKYKMGQDFILSMSKQISNLKLKKGCPKCGTMNCMYLLTGEEYSEKYLSKWPSRN